MKKRITAVALLMSIMMCACENETEINTEKGTDSKIVETNSGESEDNSKLTYLCGEYTDLYSGRAMLDLYPYSDQELRALVYWGGADDTSFEWEMHVRLNGDRLEYSDCQKSMNFVGSDGVITDQTEYENGEGYFELDNGRVKWTGAAEDDCKPCEFEKYDIGTEISDDNIVENNGIENSAARPLTESDYNETHKTWQVEGTDKIGDTNQIMNYDYLGDWYCPEWDELIRITEGGAYTYIPGLEMYGDECYSWEIVDRSDRGLCPALYIYYAGVDVSPMAYYVGGVGENYFYCVSQGIVFYKQ